jgi:hypothetical protein
VKLFAAEQPLAGATYLCRGKDGHFGAVKIRSALAASLQVLTFQKQQQQASWKLQKQQVLCAPLARVDCSFVSRIVPLGTGKMGSMLIVWHVQRA